jgi:hypothetical protein
MDDKSSVVVDDDGNDGNDDNADAEDIITLVKEEQPSKAALPISSNVFGKIADLRM